MDRKLISILIALVCCSARAAIPFIPPGVPEALSPTGVTPGTYANPTIQVNEYGQLVVAGNGTCLVDYPPSGLWSSTGSGWSTSYSFTGTGTVIPLQTGATWINPTVSGYVESTCKPTIASGSPNTITITTTSIPTGCSAISTMQVLEIGANTTVTLPAPTAGESFSLEACYSGNYTITWAIASGTLSWPSGSAPTQTRSNGACDDFEFKSYGTAYLRGQSGGNNYIGSD